MEDLIFDFEIGMNRLFKEINEVYDVKMYVSSLKLRLYEILLSDKILSNEHIEENAEHIDAILMVISEELLEDDYNYTVLELNNGINKLLKDMLVRECYENCYNINLLQMYRRV